MDWWRIWAGEAISDARECDTKDKAKKIPIVKIIERCMLIEMAAVLLCLCFSLLCSIRDLTLRFPISSWDMYSDGPSVSLLA